jgi:hypothetical protein
MLFTCVKVVNSCWCNPGVIVIIIVIVSVIIGVIIGVIVIITIIVIIVTGGIMIIVIVSLRCAVCIWPPVSFPWQRHAANAEPVRCDDGQTVVL